MNKNYKIIGPNILIAFLAWWFFRYVDYVFNVITPESFYFDFEGLVIVNFVVLVTVISLALAIFRKKRWELATSGIVGIIFLLLFGFTYINLIGVAIVVSLFEYARHAGVEEIDQRTKINSWMIVRRSAPGVVLAFFVLISFAAYQSPVAKGIAEAEQLPSASGQLMRSIIASVIGSQIEARGQEKENVINEVERQTFQELNNLLKPYFRYAPPLLAFGLFLILWGLSWIFVWLSMFMGMGIFWILKKIGFIKIEERDVKSEVLVIY